MKLNVHKIVENTKAEGPGSRFCIWTQGCSLKCKGCFMQGAWDKTKGNLIDIEDIFLKIKKQKENIEGVTFLGGEPFEQAEALFLLSKKIKALNLSIVAFSGFKYENLLNSDNPYIKKFLSEVDLLIDGEFQENNLDKTRPLAGSKNQRFIFLSKRYNSDTIMKMKNKFEIRIKPDQITLNGMGNVKKLRTLLDNVREKNEHI